MELALATGRCPVVVTDLEGRRPLVRDEDVVVLGRRDAEIAEAHGCKRIEDTAITVRCFGARLPGDGDWSPLLALLEKVRDVDAPPAIITNNAIAFAIAGEPHPAFGGIGTGKADGVWLVALGLNLLPNKSPKIGGRRWFAGY
jgi:hypothetical protein